MTQADHDHAHSHAGHAHDHAHGARVTAGNERRLRWVLLLTAGYAIVQAAVGWFAGSLALIADSGHMVSDAAALLLALIAYRIAARPPDARRTYGFQRVRVLAALANGAALLLLVAWIAWEAVVRLREPVTVLAGPMLVVAVLGLLVNVVAAIILNSGHKNDGNLRGALLHVIGDLLGSLGAILAAVGILVTGWTPLDPLLSILVSLLVVRSAWRLVTDSTQVLLQSAPHGLDPLKVEAELRDLPGIAEVGHLHAWLLADDSAVATVHVTPKPGSDPLQLPAQVSDYLRRHHRLQHVTVQVDPPRCIQPH